MNHARPSFPAQVQFFTWLFVILVSLLPIGICYRLSRSVDLPTRVWIMAAVTVGIIQFIFLYVQSRCSSDNLSYWDGMHYVSYYMYAGSSYLAFFLIMPALSVLLLLSLCLAMYGDTFGNRALTRVHFYKLIMFFYNHRMIQ